MAARVGKRYGFTPEEIAELAQELRIALWQHGLDTRVHASCFFRVAINKAIDQVRGRRRAREHIGTFARIPSKAESEPELEPLLRVRVAALSPRLRTFYEFRYVLGMSEREISAATGFCRASVRQLEVICRRSLGIVPSGKIPKLFVSPNPPRRST